MPQIFPPSSNVLFRATVLGGIFVLAGGLWVFAVLIRSPYATRSGVVQDQPVPFSHQHHVEGVGLDCRYCHANVEDGPFAGMPSTKTCMTCHSQLFVRSEILEPVRASYRDGRPLPWNRVYDLPDFVYFDHSIHVRQGIACESCHGRVDKMPLMWRTQALHMEWCLACHREPWRQMRPREAVFEMGWTADEPRSELGRRLVKVHGVEAEANKLTNCSICHR